MTNTLSNWAREYLREVRPAVVSTLNKDGSSHLTTIWYLLEDDGTLVVTTTAHSQKIKNLRRDPRITLCVGDAGRCVSLYGRVSISEDLARIRRYIDSLAERYVQDPDVRPQVVANLLQRGPVALCFLPEKITEFSVQHTGSSILS